MTRQVQTFPSVAGNVVVSFPRRANPWRVRALYVECLIDIAGNPAGILRLQHALVCDLWMLPTMQMNPSILYRVTYAPQLALADVPVTSVLRYNTAPIPDQWIQPQDQLSFFLQEGQPADFIQNITLDWDEM